MKKIKIILLIAVLGLTLNSPIVFGERSEEINTELKLLNSEIKENKGNLDGLREREEELQEKIANTKNKQASLEKEVAILGNQVAKTELDIERVNAQINEVNLEIRKLILEIENEGENIKDEKNQMGVLLRMLDKRGKASSLEVLLINNSLTDFLNEMKYLENTNEELSNSLNQLERYKEKLEADKSRRNERAKELKKLQEELKDKKKKLEYQKESKSYLIEETQEQEEEFKELLSEAKKQQQQIENEILTLEKEVRNKLNAQQKEKLDFNDSEFAWPVTENYITSTFHDPDYPFRRLIGEHSAIDIRASQGSILKAAASGYVARVKFDGTSNYAYIMIIHGDGYSTVYGHVSQVNVNVDDYVLQGQIIGRTGGLPGSAGAGKFCTGPHLHFEIRKNGIPVNPQEYLP